MSRNYKERNLKLLASYLEAGAKPEGRQMLGLEVEHITVRRASGEAVTYYEPFGIEWLLERIKGGFPRAQTENGHLIGLFCDDYTISLEPAGQLEISIAPRERLEDIARIYQGFRKLLAPVLAERDYELLCIGYQPASRVSELPLIPKKRYELMDGYFRTSGTRGRSMMRGTASTQISIDYSDEADFIRKYRAAYIVMPAIKLLSDNTPVVEGEAFPGCLARTEIWNNVDPKRCGIFPGLFDEGFGYGAYARFLWDMPPILKMTERGAEPTGDMTAGEIWAGKPLTEEDIRHVLSMSFLDVRVKNYIELRGADSMPPEYVLSYLALIKGIFFNDSALEALLSAYPVGEQDIRAAEASLRRSGYGGEIYGRSAGQFALALLALAKRGLDESEARCLEPFFALARQERTLTGKWRCGTACR